MDGIDPAILRFAARSARRFTELAEADAPAFLVHAEAATLVGLLAKVMKQCVAPVSAGETGDAGPEAEADRLRSDLAASGNYVADRETDPTVVWFRNGRKVSLRTEVRSGRIARAWLDVGRAERVELADAESLAMEPEGG